MKIWYCKVPRPEQIMLTFLAEAQEGLCTVSTVDQEQGILRIMATEGQETEALEFINALKSEIGLQEVQWQEP